jgi:pimeloyl-ACP methyl ester carboxylesterase
MSLGWHFFEKTNCRAFFKKILPARHIDLMTRRNSVFPRSERSTTVTTINSQVQMHVMTQGEGTPVLLVHAGAGSCSQWFGYAGLLGEQYKTVAPDLPGHGRTPVPPGVGSHDVVNHLADGIIALAEFQNEPVHLVGHSFGGVVSLCAAMRAPHLFASLTLIEPVCFDALRLNNHSELYAVAQSEVRELISLVDQNQHEEAMKALLAQWGFGFWDMLPEKQRRSLIASAPTVIGIGLVGALSWNVRAQALRALHVPTLLVYGDEGPAACGAVVHALAREIPNATEACVRGAGHMLPLTDRDALADLLRTHIQNVSQNHIANAA